MRLETGRKEAGKLDGEISRWVPLRDRSFLEDPPYDLPLDPDPCDGFDSWSWHLRSFLRSTKGGATAITAAVITLMTLIGTGLMVDHVWLVGKRDVLKAASDAGSVAATLRLRDLPAGMDDAAVEAQARAAAERYVRFNLEGNLRGEALDWDEVEMAIDVDRTQGTVGVEVDAPIGRTLFSAMFTDYSGPGHMLVGAGAEAGSGAIWAVLAIDVSRTMSYKLNGSVAENESEKRINIVTVAAKEFISAVGPNPDTPVAVGLVPWAWSAYGALAPSTTASAVTTALDGLNPTGGATASSRGLKKSRELLEEAPEGARRFIVLLTDGEDNRSVTGGSCGASRADCPKFRKAECDGAKEDGIGIFVIAAMANTSGALARQLTQCASSMDYAFINTSNAQAMKDTFTTIATQIQALRRTH